MAHWWSSWYVVLSCCNYSHYQISEHTVGKIRLILHPVGKASANWLWKDHFLTYVYHFDIIPQGGSDCDPSMQLHVLKWVKHSNGTWVGDVIPVMQLGAPVNLVPHFGASVDNHLTPYNSMKLAWEFWLNKYWDKCNFCRSYLFVYNFLKYSEYNDCYWIEAVVLLVHLKHCALLAMWQ